MALKILTVDDSKMIRTIVKKALQPYDCELFEAENGIEGLAQAINRNPDLIILDITMPVMTGVEMIAKLKSDPKLEKIPVLMLTAEAGKENVMKILKMGAAGYILKPFKTDVFIERVKKIVRLDDKKKSDATRYFVPEGQFQVFRLPDKVDRTVAAEMEGHLGAQFERMKNAGQSLLILDLGKNTQATMSLIKMMLAVLRQCRNEHISVGIVGSQTMAQELKAVEETRNIPIYENPEKAKEMLLLHTSG